MSSESYRNETLGHLEAWLTDAINSETTSKDVYDTLVNTVKTEIKYHSECQKRAENLLLLLKGNLSALYSTNEETAYWNGELEGEEFEKALEKYGYEYTPLHTQSEPKTYDEMVAAGYEMTGDGFWVPKEKEDKDLVPEDGC